MEKYRQNIFGIGEVYELQREGQWVEKNRESYREFGYFGGGYNVASVRRLDYSNDTQTVRSRGNLSGAKRELAATGNYNFGYFGGGIGPLSRVDRIDYSNDTATASVRGPLSLARGKLTATGNNNFGYFSGGNDPYVSTSDRIDYSNDLAVAIRRGSLPFGRASLAATGNNNFGYFGGGVGQEGGTGTRTSIFRLNYSNDLQNAISRGPLSGNKYYLTATGNSNFGYFAGGSVPYPTVRSTVDRINYANDLTSVSVRGPLSLARGSLAATGNSNFGYFCGGGITIPGPLYSTIDRVDYSNDTIVASVRAPYSEARQDHAATSSASFGGSPVSYLGAPWVATAPYGYFGGGSNPSPAAVSTVDRTDYSNDTNTAIARGPLTTNRTLHSSAGNSNFGYYFGSNTSRTSIDRIDYLNDTATASSRGFLLLASRIHSATGNSNFGYIAGGDDILISSIDRINYLNDTANASSRGPLTSAKSGSAAIGNSNFGYFGGGLNSVPTRVSTIDRLDYSNDTLATVSRGVLTIAKNSASTVGTNNFGYFGGGSIPSIIATVDRIDYSNDTSTALVRGPLSIPKYLSAATGNSNFGYFGGGGTFALTYSTVDRIDYSNDTQTASTRGPLSSARFQLAASSSQAYGGAPNTTTDPIPTYIRANTVWNDSNTLDVPYKRVLGSFGYFYQGYSGVSMPVWRVDISNDLVQPPVRSRTSSDISLEFFGGFGNNNYGYIAGGGNFSLPFNTSSQRLEYSNDTAVMLRRGNLNENRGLEPAGLNDSSFGYICGGSNPGGAGSSISRMDFSTDTATGLRRGQMTRIGTVVDGISIPNYGYIGTRGAYIFEGYTTIVDRMNFSNDNVTASIRGPLNLQRGRYAAAGNNIYGYFAGGRIPGAPNGVIISSIERITYSNDLVTASIRGNMNNTKNMFSAFSNNYYVWLSGGEGDTRIERIDTSNDTALASIRGGTTNITSAASTNARSS